MTTDIVLDSEQKHVAVAVDMTIAEKAEVFIGNGRTAEVFARTLNASCSHKA
jgi:hypothetical protein